MKTWGGVSRCCCLKAPGCKDIYICAVTGFTFEVISSDLQPDDIVLHTIKVCCDPPNEVSCSTFQISLPCQENAGGSLDLSTTALICGSPGVIKYFNYGEPAPCLTCKDLVIPRPKFINEPFAPNYQGTVAPVNAAWTEHYFEFTFDGIVVMPVTQFLRFQNRIQSNFDGDETTFCQLIYFPLTLDQPASLQFQGPTSQVDEADELVVGDVVKMRVIRNDQLQVSTDYSQEILINDVLRFTDSGVQDKPIQADVTCSMFAGVDFGIFGPTPARVDMIQIYQEALGPELMPTATILTLGQQYTAIDPTGAESPYTFRMPTGEDSAIPTGARNQSTTSQRFTMIAATGEFFWDPLLGTQVSTKDVSVPAGESALFVFNATRGWVAYSSGAFTTGTSIYIESQILAPALPGQAITLPLLAYGQTTDDDFEIVLGEVLRAKHPMRVVVDVFIGLEYICGQNDEIEVSGDIVPVVGGATNVRVALLDSFQTSRAGTFARSHNMPTAIYELATNDEIAVRITNAVSSSANLQITGYLITVKP